MPVLQERLKSQQDRNSWQGFETSCKEVHKCTRIEVSWEITQGEKIEQRFRSMTQSLRELELQQAFPVAYFSLTSFNVSFTSTQLTSSLFLSAPLAEDQTQSA